MRLDGPNERLIAECKQSLQHLTDVAERTLAIEETLKAQDEQLLRMEKAIPAFERDRSAHSTAGRSRAKGIRACGDGDELTATPTLLR